MEWNLKFIPKVDLIKWNGVSFHWWNLSSYNYLIHVHWRLAIYELMSTNLRPPSSKELHKFLCLILEGKFFQMKAFYIFCISSINCFENETTNVRCTILDIANILKINIFPSSAIFPSLHNFKIFCIFDVFHIFLFFFGFITFHCEKNICLKFS